MDHYQNMSRDDLRKEVSKLGILRSNERKLLSKQQLINVLVFPYHDSYFTDNKENKNKSKTKISKKARETLKNIFPFQSETFSKVKEFRNSIKETKYHYPNLEYDTLDDYFENVRDFVVNDLIKKKKLKVYFAITIESELPNSNDIIKFEMSTHCKVLLPNDDKISFYQQHCNEILEEYELRCAQKSNLSFYRVTNFAMTQAISRSVGYEII